MKKIHLNRVLSAALALVTVLSCVPSAGAFELSGKQNVSLTATAASVLIPDGDYYIALSRDMSKVLNIQYASKVIDRARAVVDGKSGERHEIFRVVNRGNGLISIHPTHDTNLCLNALYGPSCKKGQTLTLHNYEPGDMASLWMPFRNADGTFTLKNAACSWVIDLNNNSYSVGNRFQLYERNGTSAQKFHFIPLSAPKPSVLIPDGTYYIALYGDRNKVLNIQYASTKEDRATAVVDGKSGERHEIFRVVNQGNGLISIHPTHAPDLCLNALYGSSCRKGQRLILHRYADGDKACLWQVIKNNDGTFTLKSAACPWVIDLNDNNYRVGNRFQLYERNGTSAQSFSFLPVSAPIPDPAPVPSDISGRLNSMINGTYARKNGIGTYQVGTKYAGPYYTEQCKGFAKSVHEQLFGYNIGSTKRKPNNYQVTISGINTRLVGSLTFLGATGESDGAVCNLFSKARPGDFIQVRRRHSGSHSMIVLSTDANSVRVYEANVDNKNGIEVNTYTWRQFCEKNESFSLYTAKDYRLH